MERELLEEFLPKFLLDYFTIVKFKKLGDIETKKMFYEIYLDEKNLIHKEGVVSEDYESKGFLPSSRVQDFPIRGKAVYLIIRKRRWRNKQTKKEIQNTYSFVSKGAKLTEEISDFLKDTGRDTRSNIASYFIIKPDKLRRHYKKHKSNFNQWSQKAHCEDYLLYPYNLTELISIDELALSDGELYTFVTSKQGKGRKRTIIASIKGTRSEDIIKVLNKLPLKQRNRVKEVTLDMAKNMQSAISMSFPMADVVIDRFHAVKLVIEALQHVRVKYRWKEIDKENKLILKAKKQGVKYRPKIYSNGDSPKQLLARSRHLLMKKEKEWTFNQKERAVILFHHYPEIKKAYNHVMKFRNIYENRSKQMALTQFECWIEETNKINIKEFASTAKSINYHLDKIINFFNNRNTNANAESFNSKIKLFRANLRGVTDKAFFLFRLEKLFA